MNKERILNLRDEFWKLMIIESLGEESFKKVEKHCLERLYDSNELEFEVFNLCNDD